jgi:proline iminopeptidase
MDKAMNQKMSAAGEYTIPVNGIELWYRVTGAGPVLVVQPPGWGIGVEVYEQTFKPLESEFTIVYYDTRGTGKSQAPDNADDINVGAIVEDLEALRVHLEMDSFALSGHSHGGLIALNYALKYPQYLSHLLLVDAQLVGQLEHGQNVQQEEQRVFSELVKDATFAEALKFFQSAGSFGALFQMKSDAEFSAFLARIMPLYLKNSQYAPNLQEYVKNHKLPLAALIATASSDERFPVTAKLNTIKIPTLVLNGMYDIFCSAARAGAMHEHMQGSKLVVFENSGHFPWVEEPELFFATVTNFLKSRS